MPFPSSMSNGWSRTLTRAQVTACQRIRNQMDGTSRKTGKSAAGWSVFMTPTIGPPVYLELRHYFVGGGVARWVIDLEGEVTAHNDLGQSPQMIPVEAVAA